MKHISIRTRLWVALTASILLGGLFFQAQPSGALTKPALQRALLATTKLLIVDGDLNLLGTCSGTYIGQGVIVTNFHCVGHTDLYGPDDSGQGLKHGDTYHPEGWVGVAPLKDPKQAPKPAYFAKYVAGTPDHDIAVVKIFRMIDPKAKLPTDIPIVPMTITDSDKVELGAIVSVIGYPGVGGETITFSEGKISGYDDLNEDGVNDAFKTTAAINPGNSGGLAVDENGDQIGVPAFSRPGGAGINGILQINQWVPYINQVINLGNVTPGPVPGLTSTPGVGPTTVPGSGPFGAVTFGTAVANGELTGQGTKFESGIKQVIGVFAYQGMKNGMKWGWTWDYNGQTVIDNQNTQTWTDGPSGTTGVQLANKKALPDGSYVLHLYVNGKGVQQGTFIIGKANATPLPATPGTSQDTGVVIQGQITDSNTAQGIPGAVMVLLKPGATVDQWDKSQGDELADAVGVADQDGFYVTSPGLARKQTYTVIIGAKGYQRRVFEAGLEVTKDDPAVVDIDAISLDKR